MACLREQALDGRLGTVSCNEEGCVFRRFSRFGSETTFGESPEAYCVLQLRLRAGDSEDAEDPGEPAGEEQRSVRDNDGAGPNIDSLMRDPEAVRKYLYGIDHGQIYIHPDGPWTDLNFAIDPTLNPDTINVTDGNGKVLKTLKDPEGKSEWVEWDTENDRPMGLPAESGRNEGKSSAFVRQLENLAHEIIIDYGFEEFDRVWRKWQRQGGNETMCGASGTERPSEEFIPVDLDDPDEDFGLKTGNATDADKFAAETLEAFRSYGSRDEEVIVSEEEFSKLVTLMSPGNENLRGRLWDWYDRRPGISREATDGDSRPPTPDSDGAWEWTVQAIRDLVDQRLREHGVVPGETLGHSCSCHRRRDKPCYVCFSFGCTYHRDRDIATVERDPDKERNV